MPWAMHIFMPINIMAAGRAIHASHLLLDQEPDESVEDVGPPQTLVTPAVAPRDAIFEAAKRKETYDNDETTAPSLSEDSCGAVFDGGWEKDLEDDYWKEIHFARTADFSYIRSSTGQSLGEWLETLKVLRQCPERVFVVVHFFSGKRREGDIEERII